MNHPEDTKKDFLGKVEGFVAVAQQIHRELDDHPLVFGDELGVRSLVASRTPLDKRGVGPRNVRPIRDAGVLHEVPIRSQGRSGNFLHYNRFRPRASPKVPRRAC